MQQQGMGLLIKSVIDRTAAVIGLVALSPVLAGTAIGIYATMGGPAFFRQRRPGFRGKPFLVVKFRTMKVAYDASGRPLPDAERLTTFGKFLRILSLDELPQLWNVLHGELSLVGPRPLLMQYLSRYSSEQARRHDVLPGITGWAQVNGRNLLEWDERFRLDVWYVDHWSLWLDLKILGLTVLRVLDRRGVSHHGHATMFEFMGSEARPDRLRESATGTRSS